MVRTPKLYNVPALLGAADLALEKDPARLPELKKMLNHPVGGMRYWATVGCFLLGQQAVSVKPLIYKKLTDESHEVRNMAAWTIINFGDKKTGLKTIESLLKQKSYALLTTLNLIDWLGDDAKSLIPTVQGLKVTGYEKRMQDQLLLKYGLIKEIPKKQKKKKRV